MAQAAVAGCIVTNLVVQKLLMSKHISPALVIAVVALFVALGSASYAAIKLPKNSVGRPQIQNNAINSAKVADKSLKANDFKAGQLPKGATGPRGPSTAYSTYRDLISPPPLDKGTETTVMVLQVPAGEYVAFSKLVLDTTGASGTATCKLASDTDYDATFVTAAGVGGYPCSNMVTHTFTSEGTFSLIVSTPASPAGSMRAGNGKIIAVKVDDVQNVACCG